jgi:hypothetical protein
MARFAEVVDSDSYLPSDARFAGLSEYRQQPQIVSDYIRKKQFKFQPTSDTSDLFQTFLNLQANPERLFTATAKMPDTPFGNLSQYMGV